MSSLKQFVWQKRNQQKKTARKMMVKLFTGVGTYINPGNTDVLRIPRSQSSAVTAENLDNPFLAPSDSFDPSDERALSASGEPLEPFQPPLDAGDGKCSYVQVPVLPASLKYECSKKLDHLKVRN